MRKTDKTKKAVVAVTYYYLAVVVCRFRRPVRFVLFFFRATGGGAGGGRRAGGDAGLREALPEGTGEVLHHDRGAGGAATGLVQRETSFDGSRCIFGTASTMKPTVFVHPVLGRGAAAVTAVVVDDAVVYF